MLAAVKDEPELVALPPKQLRPTVFPFVAYKTKQAMEGGTEVRVWEGGGHPGMVV